MAAAAGLDMGPTDLPGPTGESNRYTMIPRGTILCLGETAELVLAQSIQALTTGNKVVAIAPGATKVLNHLINSNLPIIAIDGTLKPESIGKIKELDAVAFYGNSEQLQSLRHYLAQSSGPILPVISEIISPGAYVLEKTVSTDTTAAGGNAQLLAEIC